MDHAPTPFLEKPSSSNLNILKLVEEKEYLKKFNKKEIKITLGLSSDFINILIKEGINTFNGQFNLKEMQSKDKYFRMFDTIEEAYKEFLTIFNENQFNIKIEENNLILNVEIEHSHKKNVISFILENSQIKKEDLIKSLYSLANNYIQENHGLKQDINNLRDKINRMEVKINSIENKIDQLLSFKKDKKEEKNDIFENVLMQSQIIENKIQISLLKSWLPFNNKNNLKCKLIYDAQRDGDKASTFHKLCDNKNSTLTIISTSDNKKIGGFLSKSFGSNKGFINDNDAFLFSLNYNEKYISLNKGKNYEDRDECGPIFGYYCIYIVDNFFTNHSNYYQPYTCRYDFGKRSNNIEHNFIVINLEVYEIFQ